MVCLEEELPKCPGGKHVPKTSWKGDRIANIAWCLFILCQSYGSHYNVIDGDGVGVGYKTERQLSSHYNPGAGGNSQDQFVSMGQHHGQRQTPGSVVAFHPCLVFN